MSWQGSTVTLSLPSILYTKCTAQNFYTPAAGGPTTNILYAPPTGVASIQTNCINVVVLTDTDVSITSWPGIGMLTGGTLPSSSTFQLVITKLDDTLMA